MKSLRRKIFYLIYICLLYETAMLVIWAIQSKTISNFDFFEAFILGFIVWISLLWSGKIPLSKEKK
jgi:NADH:ubiquinone oxidoreductase subunit 3 (subunit A)